MESFPESFVGIGCELTMRNGYPVVVRVLAGGGAASAGLQSGDRITHIDDTSTHQKSLGDVVVKLRGNPDTVVQVGVLRDQRPIKVDVTRKPMQRDPEGYRAQER